MNMQDAVTQEIVSVFGSENGSCEDSPINSFDGREWAHSFVNAVKRNPEIATDIDTMHTWFASALMRGYDERRFRSKEYKRSVRRVLVPWWKRLFVSLERFGH